MIILENEYLRAVIVTRGAELQSLYNKKTGIEHIWSGEATYWGKHSPVLFPIVGSLKENTYFYNNQSFSLPRHGFARDKTFEENSVTSTEAVFTVTHDLHTLTVYPFNFILKLRYRLHESLLTCTYEVENPGKEVLLFSLGAHPAFGVPFLQGTGYEDYYLEFNKTETLQRWKLRDGLVSSETSLTPRTNNKLYLHAGLFEEDAILLKNMLSNSITLGCDKHPHGFHFTFRDFPFFGIWAAKNAPFVCLEPWCGIADSITHNQQLQEKEGIQTLSPGGHWQRSWEIECF